MNRSLSIAPASFSHKRILRSKYNEGRQEDELNFEQRQSLAVRIGKSKGAVLSRGAEYEAKRAKAGNRNKYLIVRLGALGDIIHTLPAQQLLHRKQPHSEIHWITEAPYLDFLQSVPGIDRLWVVDTRKWRTRPASLNEFVRLVGALRKEQFKAAIDFQGLLKSSILTRLSGATRRIGFGKHQTRESAAAWFYSASLSVTTKGRHRIEQNLQLLSAIGLEDAELQESAIPRIPFQLPEESSKYIDDQFQRFSVPDTPVILNPGAGWPTKLWPVKRFAELARRITGELKRSVIVAWGPGEQELAEDIVGDHSEDRVIAFPTSILELAALCRRSSLMVAGDTGPLHLAVATGLPTVAIMGPTYGWRNGPFNPTDEIVTHKQPCPRPYKRHCDDHFCMDIPVDDVFEAVKRRLSRPTAPASPERSSIPSEVVE